MDPAALQALMLKDNNPHAQAVSNADVLQSEIDRLQARVAELKLAAELALDSLDDGDDGVAHRILSAAVGR